MRRHKNDERNRARRGDEGDSEYRPGYRDEQNVGRPVTDQSGPSGWDQRGMSGYGGGGSFGGMGYPMGVGGHGTYVAGHRSTGQGYGPGGDAYQAPERSRDWAPYRDELDRTPVPQAGRDIPRWSSQGEQSFRGRGPRGYRRSDQRILEDVCDRLTEDHDIDASDIDVKVEAGEVTLEGTVDERRLKWLAEEIASRCSGVVDVHNHLRVKRHQGQAAGEDMQRVAEGQPQNGNGGNPQRTSPSRST